MLAMVTPTAVTLEDVVAQQRGHKTTNNTSAAASATKRSVGGVQRPDTACHPATTNVQAAPTVPPAKRVAFVQGDTLNPTQAPPPTETVDPLFPPVVKLTKASGPASRYQLGRLREPSLLEAFRLYLAYLHDKPTDVCIDGKTSASIRLRLTTEGLPSKRAKLLELYKQFYAAYGLSEADAEADLSALRAQTSTNRMAYLQTARACGLKAAQAAPVMAPHKIKGAATKAPKVTGANTVRPDLPLAAPTNSLSGPTVRGAASNSRLPLTNNECGTEAKRGMLNLRLCLTPAQRVLILRPQLPPPH
nr:unnamed protein product [Callosobruchus analis]